MDRSCPIGVHRQGVKVPHAVPLLRGQTRNQRYVSLPFYLRASLILPTQDGTFNIEALKRDELVEWINTHNIGPVAKRVTKKGMHAHLLLFGMRRSHFAEIIKAISSASKHEQPTQEDIWECIREVSHALPS